MSDEKTQTDTAEGQSELTAVFMREQRGKFTAIPVSEVTRTPASSGTFKLYVNKYWGVTDDDYILLYRGYSPQCNDSKSVVESIISSSSHIATKVKRIDAVWLPHKCDA